MQEKIVACNSKALVLVADESKLSSALGKQNNFFCMDVIDTHGCKIDIYSMPPPPSSIYSLLSPRFLFLIIHPIL